MSAFYPQSSPYDTDGTYQINQMSVSETSKDIFNQNFKENLYPINPSYKNSKNSLNNQSSNLQYSEGFDSNSVFGDLTSFQRSQQNKQFAKLQNNGRMFGQNMNAKKLMNMASLAIDSVAESEFDQGDAQMLRNKKLVPLKFKESRSNSITNPRQSNNQRI